jgi:hypothetical protein
MLVLLVDVKSITERNNASGVMSLPPMEEQVLEKKIYIYSPY